MLEVFCNSLETCDVKNRHLSSGVCWVAICSAGNLYLQTLDRSPSEKLGFGKMFESVMADSTSCKEGVFL